MGLAAAELADAFAGPAAFVSPLWLHPATSAAEIPAISLTAIFMENSPPRPEAYLNSFSASWNQPLGA